jgi:leucyl aminopeptidase
MRIRSGAPEGADTIAVGVVEGATLEPAPLQALLDSGEAKPTLRHVAVVHHEGTRYVLVGLGAEPTAEQVREAAASVVGRAKEIGTRVLAWDGPEPAAFAEAAAMADYVFLEYKAGDDDEAGGDNLLEELVVREGGEEAGIVAAAVNRARDLQNRPANDCTPEALAARARETGLPCEVWGRDQIVEAGMGAFAAVAQGAAVEPQLITLRYEGGGEGAPTLGLVGKAVTFDTGGISIKGALGMNEMKFDMSGGATVLEAIAAIAELQLPVNVIAVIGATENSVDGRAMRPGDIVRARTGTTIEILNTDAEGRLVLCDCLAHAIEQGADRLIDVATLTGGIVMTFGKGHAGLFATDDPLADTLLAAGERTGERLWRLPLDRFYDDMIKGVYADIANAVESRQAHSITAAQFLGRFVGDTPWAHLDIAGVAWDNGRAYTPKGGAGWGVRLLVDVARSL